MLPGLWVAREADESILGNTVRKSGSAKIIVCEEESDANRAANLGWSHLRINLARSRGVTRG